MGRNRATVPRSGSLVFLFRASPFPLSWSKEWRALVLADFPRSSPINSTSWTASTSCWPLSHLSRKIESTIDCRSFNLASTSSSFDSFSMSSDEPWLIQELRSTCSTTKSTGLEFLPSVLRVILWSVFLSFLSQSSWMIWLAAAVIEFDPRAELLARSPDLDLEEWWRSIRVASVPSNDSQRLWPCASSAASSGQAQASTSNPLTLRPRVRTLSQKPI